LIKINEESMDVDSITDKAVEDVTARMQADHRYNVPHGVLFRAIIPERDFEPPQHLQDTNTQPYTKDTLLEILGLYHIAPPSAYGKSQPMTAG
jgi:hypothetical protein